jgi:2-phospho-L-lactate/phosphoenolpyruvate guanylyltransferase
MGTFAVIPVKRFAAAKQRLRATLPAAIVPELAAAMLTDVLTALARSERVGRIVLVSGERRVGPLAAAAGALLLDDPADDGHSPAAARGLAAALAEGAHTVALLPGDCPLLDPAELDRALACLEAEAGEARAAIVPDRHGEGTNALLLSPPDALAPSFGPGSHRRHAELAAAAGTAARTELLASLALDLDTPADLRALAERLGAEPQRAPATAALLAALPAPAAPAGSAGGNR